MSSSCNSYNSASNTNLSVFDESVFSSSESLSSLAEARAPAPTRTDNSYNLYSTSSSLRWRALLADVYWQRSATLFVFLVLLASCTFFFLLGEESRTFSGLRRSRIAFPVTIIATAGGSGSAAAEAINIIVIACGNPSPDPEYFGLINIKSLLMARAASPAASARRYNFVFVTNVPFEEFYSSQINFDVTRFIRDDPLLQYSLISMVELDEVSAAAGAKGAQDGLNNIFKHCAGVRLKFPHFFLARFPLMKRAIYVDWDSVITCDLTTLWDKGLEGWPQTAVMSMAKNDPTGLSQKDSYRTPGANEEPLYQREFPHPAVGGLSSGVIVWNFEAFGRRADALSSSEVFGWRALSSSSLPPLFTVADEWWALILKIVRARLPNTTAVPDYWVLTAAFPLGDQDIINELLYLREGWVAPPMAPEYNWCLADVVSSDEFIKSGLTRPSVCVYHLCGSRIISDQMRSDPKTPDPAIGLVDFYRSAFMPSLTAQAATPY